MEFEMAAQESLNEAMYQKVMSGIGHGLDCINDSAITGSVKSSMASARVSASHMAKLRSGLHDFRRDSLSLEDSQLIDSLLKDYRQSREVTKNLATKL